MKELRDQNQVIQMKVNMTVTSDNRLNIWNGNTRTVSEDPLVSGKRLVYKSNIWSMKSEVLF
jgi:hypothetical protein